MKHVVCFLILFVLVLFPCKESFAGEDCWGCVVFFECYDCFNQFATGGLACSTSGCLSCTLTGVCDLTGGGGCFLPGTNVETSRGMKAIEELEVGDLVLGFDDSEIMAFYNIESTYKVLQYRYYVINGKLRVTGTHPFYLEGEWVEASEIKVGDHLKGKGSESILVETIEIINKGVRVYNIEVADAHTFYVEGVLVHNKGPLPGLP